MSNNMLLILMMAVGVCLSYDKLTVFYDSMDVDSKSFLDNQLYPLFKKSHNYTIMFIPFGYTKMTTYYFKNAHKSSYEFECSFGFRQCELNKLHACVTSNMQVDDMERFDIVQCLMKSDGEVNTLIDACLKNEWLKSTVSECYDLEGDKMLAYYGNATSRLDIRHFPYVIINDEKLAAFQPKIRTNFERFMSEYNVCRKNSHMVDEFCLERLLSSAAGLVASIAITISAAFLALLC